MLDDARSAYRYVDEAKIHESDVEKIIRLKELEMEEKERERKARITKIKIICALVFFIIGVIALLIAFLSGEKYENSVGIIGLVLISVSGFIWLDK